MPSRPYTEERREALEEMVQFAEAFVRREAAKMQLLEQVMHGEITTDTLYNLVASTEGIGMYGVEQKVSHKDWNLLREQITRYILFSKRLTKDELLPLELIIKEQAADIAARSRNIYAIQPLLHPKQLDDRMKWVEKARGMGGSGDRE